MKNKIEFNKNINNPKISIIVVTYNNDKYIEKCLNSILVQSYKNIEIIVVDDGSTDKTFSIGTRYLKKDLRIKFIHQENMGVGSARNVGLRNASGDYITFVDSDDYIMPNLMSEYIYYLNKYPESLLISGYREINNDNIVYTYNQDLKIVSIQS